MCLYTGKFDVEDEDFTLEAVRFIVREGEVAFHFTGLDPDHGDFNTDGVAVWTENGFFMAARIELHYENYNREERDAVSIRFDAVRRDEDLATCRVEGVWIEGGETSEIRSDLTLIEHPGCEETCNVSSFWKRSFPRRHCNLRYGGSSSFLR